METTKERGFDLLELMEAKGGKCGSTNYLKGFATCTNGVAYDLRMESTVRLSPCGRFAFFLATESKNGTGEIPIFELSTGHFRLASGFSGLSYCEMNDLFELVCEMKEEDWNFYDPLGSTVVALSLNKEGRLSMRIIRTEEATKENASGRYWLIHQRGQVKLERHILKEQKSGRIGFYRWKEAA